jgi:hypothetical protein
MDLTKIDNVMVEGIDHKDAPDYVDAYISSADYRGLEMTEQELEELNENSEFVYEQVMKHLY